VAYITPQISSLEKALAVANAKLEREYLMRRTAELAQDDAENRSRELEATLNNMEENYDRVSEEIVFQEEEMEDLNNEWARKESDFWHQLDEMKEESNVVY